MFDYFHPSERYFFMDASNYGSIPASFYGYAVLSDRLIDRDNYTPNDIEHLDGTGTYIYIRRTDNEIVIGQDINAGFGLYLYRDGDYYAVSNSCQYLADHVCSGHPLTLNRTYADHLFVTQVCSLSGSQTMFVEICQLPRDSEVHIALKSGAMTIARVDYREETIPIDSAEGMRLLDRWFDKWTEIFRKLQSYTDNISVSLSGGFDSRTAFMIVLLSGIDINRIRVRSFHDSLYTHSEDYEIASRIAAYYGFELNRDPFCGEKIPYSLRDVMNIVYYGKLPFHKEMYYRTEFYPKKSFMVPGAGSDHLRHWDMTPLVFRNFFDYRCNEYSCKLGAELRRAISDIVTDTIDNAAEKYGITDRNSNALMMKYYRDSRCPTHVGKMQADDYHAGLYNLCPMLDASLYRLKSTVAGWPDRNLPLAVIYMRYCPKLLDFPFNGGRSIDPETIARAEAINAKWPRLHAAYPFADINLGNIPVPKKVTDAALSNAEIDQYLLKILQSKAFRDQFCTAFDSELYDQALYHAQTDDYYPLRQCYPILAAVKAIQDIRISRGEISEADPTRTNAFDSLEAYSGDLPVFKNEHAILARLNNLICCRADIVVTGGEPRMDIISCSDPFLKCTQPAFLQKNGFGLMLVSNEGKLEVALKVIDGTRLDIALRGLDVRDPGNGSRIPYWQEITTVSLNGKKQDVFPTRIWHDKPCRIQRAVQPGETVTLSFSWQPCRYEETEAANQSLHAKVRRLGHKIKRHIKH